MGILLSTIWVHKSKLHFTERIAAIGACPGFLTHGMSFYMLSSSDGASKTYQDRAEESFSLSFLSLPRR